MKMLEILLATYNSERYLGQQIESILAQDYHDWRLLVRDGGSTDATLDIIKRFCEARPGQIVLVPSTGRFCANDNFSALLNAASAPYVMFSDHDDIWLPRKVSLTMREMQQAEARYGSDIPLLAFSDMEVVDDALTVIAPSYFALQRLSPERISLNQLLTQNIPCGCTMLLNKKLRTLAAPIPPDAVMHDHWVALTAAAFGRLVYLPQATVRYRQHGTNIFGAKKYGLKYLFGKICGGREVLWQRYLQDVGQARAFHGRFKDRLSPEQAQMLEDFGNFSRHSCFKRWKTLFRYRIFKDGLGRNLGVFLLSLCAPPDASAKVAPPCRKG